MSMTVFQALNGATFAALLFIVASGFTLIFGLMRIVNLAHGALYLVGGYLGLVIAGRSGSFTLALVGAAIAIAIVGFLAYTLLLRFVGGNVLRQVLLTLGLALVLDDVALVIFGGDAFTVPIPETLRGPVQFGTLVYPRYRLFLLLFSVLVFIGLTLLLRSTRLGSLIRAGVDDAEWGQRVVAFVVPERGTEPPTLDEVRDVVRAAMPVAAAPKELRLVDSLPRTGLGKIRRSSLPLGDTAHGRSS